MQREQQRKCECHAEEEKQSVPELPVESEHDTHLAEIHRKAYRVHGAAAIRNLCNVLTRLLRTILVCRYCTLSS